MFLRARRSRRPVLNGPHRTPALTGTRAANFFFFRPPKVVANGTEIVVSRVPCVIALIPRGGDDEGDTCFLRVIPAATPNESKLS